MSRRYSDPIERGMGVGEFLAFLLVVAISAWAFFSAGFTTTPSVARVVSMHDVPSSVDRTETGSIVRAAPGGSSVTVPVPTPRPD